MYSADDRGSFQVSGETTNAPITAMYEVSPGIVTLSSHFKTSDGRIDVRLPPAFEGTLAGKTTGYKALIEYKEDLDDPSGQGRHRSFESIESSKEAFRSKISWDGDMHEQGVSDTITSNAPVFVRV
jgi:hypothetical protein